MSSPSSVLQPPSPPSGVPPPPPPSGAPPPPPPSGTPPPTNTSTANYFFGFVVTFVVLLLLFVGCGIGSWRRFRLIGTALDERLQDMEGTSFVGRKRGRRRRVRPVFWEMWTHSRQSTRLAPASSEKHKWAEIQPISAGFIWSRSKSKSNARLPKPDVSARTPGQHGDDSVPGVGTTLLSFIFPRRPSFDHHPPRPPPAERLPPEAIQVAVLIAMPSPPSLTSHSVTNGPDYVGQSRAGEYQIGVVRMPWS